MSALLKIMSLLKTSKVPVDPSQFLRFLGQVLMNSGRPDFDIFQQQDASEVLSVILNELCSESPIASDVITVNVKNTVTCNECFQSNIWEDHCMMLQLPVCKSVQRSVETLLKSEELSGNNLYFCNFCSALKPAIIEHEFSRVGSLLIVHLKRFLNLGDSVTKDTAAVTCEPQIRIPVMVDSEVSSHKTFRLVGTINHSGNLNSGHYTAHILNSTSNSWFHCNDAAVVPCKKLALEDSSYILFYKAI